MHSNTIQIPTMLTINEAAKRTGLAKFHVRQLALQNKVKHIRAGKKILINFEKLIEYLNEGSAELNIGLDKVKIRKIN